MEEGRFSRTEQLLGKEALTRLAGARVAVFGLGGVGGHAAEALGRSGVGFLDLYDKDVVSLSNINRQVAALQSTLGQSKAEVMRRRILDINPEAKVRAINCFYLPETADQIDLSEYDYIVDAVDTVTAKLELAVRAKTADVPIISCMGAGNKLDPTRFEVADLYRTSVCPLAKVMRRECRARGIEELKVVYSREEPIARENRQVPGSVAFVPSVAGLILAGEVVKDLLSLV
ncbi:MAG: tRNA threonylcarbamoyladenosine dehydratase [Lachnospiraceae bacterium]|nr:tRNA threonylcarbamoyladenosine dehydratase [Lachnospiraceae bacterium]